ncbi:S1 family peptidase [Desulfoglaeba alkanexedens]|uniref:Trypsin-like peptidase domain-containing protein n=1 Tax=Desulfoglaeba alkanexedens ALDC TaxID=980445 RepID=A0A4P8KZV0_9BACT|nr:serine protease [Desulfoglaeba alkanexedens]QCQ21097.1 trypsin-like peptidase domain-containing protein [Desulfoglaeba alkanexedens ALDC]
MEMTAAERLVVFALILCVPAVPSGRAFAEELPEIIQQIRPGVVAVGTVQPMRRPPAAFLGTGFAVDDGRLVATNAHVIPEKLDTARKETLAVFVGRGQEVEAREAQVTAEDRDHDLVLLQIQGPPLPPLRLSERRVREGEAVAFTGFPIGMILGLYPVTHRGIISSVTLDVIPSLSARQLDRVAIQKLKNASEVYQLDATAYPGNSGSPVYDPDTGVVIGILNKVLVREGKERVLERPTGISYAVPIRHAIALIEKAGRRH